MTTRLAAAVADVGVPDVWTEVREVDSGTAAARPTPTTARERWAEVMATSHQGLALLGVDERFEFLCDRGASALGVTAASLIGVDLFEAIPELTAEDRAVIAGSANAGTPVMVMCTRRRPDGRIWALRLTFVPRRRPDGTASGLIVLIHDITPLRIVQDQRRRAQHRLTAVEDEEQRRIRREMHDGPIQLLAALSLRVGTSLGRGIDAPDLRDLQLAVEHAGRELRRILADPIAPPGASTPAELLRRWAAPLLEETELRLEVTDHSEHQMNPATTEALFAFVHGAIRRARSTTGSRRLDVALTDDGAGHRLVLTVPVRTRPAIEVDDGRFAARAAKRYAALLGGSYEEVDDAGTTTMIAWLPQLEEAGWGDSAAGEVAAPVEVDDGRVADPVAHGVELSDADYEAMACASFQGMMTLDRDLRVRSVNDAYTHAARRPADRIVGRDLESLFHADDFGRLRPLVRRVQQGEPVRFEWRRRTPDGVPRWIQVAASPRLDRDGRFDGALLVTLDTTELHLAEDLRDSVLADLDRARRAARRRTVRRLAAGPIQTLERVDERLTALVGRDPVDDVVTLIRRELRRSIVALRNSVSLIADPDPAAGPWDEILRSSLAVTLRTSPIELGIADRTARSPEDHQADALLRIALEAVRNAVQHGRAGRVTVALDEIDDRYWLTVIDDGIGIDPETVRPRPGHLGITSMLERATELGGTLRIERGRRRGTVVTATIPRADITLVPI